MEPFMLFIAYPLLYSIPYKRVPEKRHERKESHGYGTKMKGIAFASTENSAVNLFVYFY